MPHRFVWRTIRDVIAYRILGVKDSRHRIALGVAVGLFVTMTPTLGFQMIIAVMLASLVGANRAVTIPVVWISNPLTAVPLYYTNWRIGHMIRTGSLASDPAVRKTLANLIAAKGGLIAHVSNFFDPSFWRELAVVLGELGLDLWIGSVLGGLVLALISYPICRRAVRIYRLARRHELHLGRSARRDPAPMNVSPDESQEPVNSKAPS